MNHLMEFITSAALIGLGATLIFELWAQLLKLALKITPSNICFVGRWLRYMPGGVFSHKNIAATAKKRGECITGWIAHYLIGISFASAFVAMAGEAWLRRPAPLPALFFGIVTVLAPFLILQPSLGIGIAASKASNPGQARLRSLMNHAAFGMGLYLSGLLASRLWWGLG